MTATLSTTNLWKVYGSGDQAVEAVRDVSLTADAGEFIAIVGPSGSGKTSLLAMLGGLLTPTRGSITVDGREIGALSARARAEYRRSRVGYVFQANNLLPFLTARENLLIMQAIGGRGDARRADQLLDELGLTTRARALATELSASALAGNLVDKVHFFYAPKIIGGRRARGMVGGDGCACIADAARLADVRIRRIQDDILVSGYIMK